MYFLDEDGSDHHAMSDEEARNALERLLELRRKRPEEISKREAIEACMSVAELVRGIFGAPAMAAGVMLPFEAYRKLTATEQRRALVDTLRLGLPIMQPGASGPLARALLALDGGQILPPLRPAGVGRRRRDPYDIAAAELDALKWIQWQRGLGRKAKDAELEVAGALHMSLAALKKWRGELAKVFGADHVRSQLDLATAVGRIELEARQRATDWEEAFASAPDDAALCRASTFSERLIAHPATEQRLLFPIAEPGPFFLDTDEGLGLWSASVVLARDLVEIAARRKAAMPKRTTLRAAHRKARATG
jgi:hypothetical protein